MTIASRPDRFAPEEIIAVPFEEEDGWARVGLNVAEETKIRSNAGLSGHSVVTTLNTIPRLLDPGIELN